MLSILSKINRGCGALGILRKRRLSILSKINKSNILLSWAWDFRSFQFYPRSTRTFHRSHLRHNRLFQFYPRSTKAWWDRGWTKMTIAFNSIQDQLNGTIVMPNGQVLTFNSIQDQL